MKLAGETMVDRSTRCYLDSNVITRLLEHGPDSEAVESLVAGAASDRWLLVVSVLSLLEVTRERNRPVDPAKYARVTSFFESNFIVVRDLDRLLARSAQELIYNYLWLRPNDAAHLATAIDTGCHVFYTYDRELIDRFDNERGLRVLKPGMAVDVDVTDLPLFGSDDPSSSR